jgi:DNA-binding transcriptional LysR family regulator
MRGTEFAELTAFVAVAEQRSFSKAAAQLSIAPSTLSQTIRALEERLGVRLLNRTTRSVAPTEAGERLLGQLQPAFEGVADAVESINAFREKPMGRLRLLMSRPTGIGVIEPVIAPFMRAYPEISLDIVTDDSHIDLIAGRFDAGLSIGERIERDMVAVRLIEGVHVVCIAAPKYLEAHPAPVMPEDLRTHECIRVRSQWDGVIHPWNFQHAGSKSEVVPHGRLILNDLYLAMRAAVAGAGVAYLPYNTAAPSIRDGRVVSLLKDWCPVLSGIYVYYPSRRQIPAPLQAFVDFARKATVGQIV